MYKLCRTEKSLARQRELENGFLEYIETVSFFEIEIARLCRSLGIPRKTFYRYFGTKEDALLALVDHRLMDLQALSAGQLGQTEDSLKQGLQVFFSYWKEQERFLSILNRNYLTGILYARSVLLFNVATGLTENIPFEASEPEDTAESYHSHFIHSGMLSLMLQWHASGYKKSVEEMVSIAEPLLTRPIRSILDNYKP